MPHTITLTLSCPQRPGIVHAVSSFLFSHNFDIAEHQQFDDTRSQEFFQRTTFVCTTHSTDGNADVVARLTDEFAPVATEFGMTFRFVDTPRKPRVVVMVSKMGHCLIDLIFRWRAGTLGGELVAVVSNHEVLRPMAEAAGLPFLHIPVTPDTKPEAERALLALVDELEADLVVLARYMQVLSDETCQTLRGRAINIHHSFLPGFKGAKPYHQAFDRGVKLVGATAHYVTPDLDEGPIIEQEVIRIDHSFDPARLATVGQDAEALALSRAVRWHCENRVLLHGHRTVVFS
ncbi:formyltetrahydrofolate deformylase [Mycolicibacterium llatzerense]|uniref:formyltetrahydrofolate deformylase n=1 Tax=Mycolicibacterium llatzerense TaxID=280871 RepID=UPI0021B61264|nr:formyltetrahydrofolate deformylase [Mycolicibacterium llatzerense]MCT7363725.1 formyltetrahydrofolate deformylase [Mycolicibacterium llatzerense]